MALQIGQGGVVDEEFGEITIGSGEEIGAMAGVAHPDVNHPRTGVEGGSLGAFEFAIDVAAEDLAIIDGFEDVPAGIQFAEPVVRAPNAGEKEVVILVAEAEVGGIGAPGAHIHDHLPAFLAAQDGEDGAGGGAGNGKRPPGFEDGGIGDDIGCGEVDGSPAVQSAGTVRGVEGGSRVQGDGVVGTGAAVGEGRDGLAVAQHHFGSIQPENQAPCGRRQVRWWRGGLGFDGGMGGGGGEVLAPDDVVLQPGDGVGVDHREGGNRAFFVGRLELKVLLPGVIGLSAQGTDGVGGVDVDEFVGGEPGDIIDRAFSDVHFHDRACGGLADGQVSRFGIDEAAIIGRPGPEAEIPGFAIVDFVDDLLVAGGGVGQAHGEVFLGLLDEGDPRAGMVG